MEGKVVKMPKLESISTYMACEGKASDTLHQ